MIDREVLARRHNPVLTAADTESPLTVGNGGFAFTADVTGFQSMYSHYSVFPLCTMSEWGWHSEPAPDGVRYTLDDVEKTVYEYGGRVYEYASERKSGSEAAYDWLRHNPHRLNLARISLLWDGGGISDISDVHQELDLYTGILYSAFSLNGSRVSVRTVCAQSADVLGFSIECETPERLSVLVSFPYGSHLKDASDWTKDDRHTTEGSDCDGGFLLKRALDSDTYSVLIGGVEEIRRTRTHSFEFRSNEFTLSFAPDEPDNNWHFSRVLRDSAEGWERFWQSGGAVDFSRVSDPRARELERRTVLSQYLTAAQCAGNIPPQETGLSCNSWYGKFHLEMHILHAAWFALWGRGHLLEKSFKWYRDILEKAKDNAARNGFKGARWPKMVGSEGIDSPSWIAVLLVWQQPHILYMLELVRLGKPEPEREAFMREYWPLVRETARFMRDFLRYNEQTGRYDLAPPLIPAQEEHAPMDTLNPMFELCYWRFGLELAAGWAEKTGEDPEDWRETAKKIAVPKVLNGLYPAHENCPDTFTAFNLDHPSMLYCYGFIPYDGIDEEAMSRTVDRVLECWDKSTMWGWDFALCAMTLTRLGRHEDAVNILLADTAKNSYTVSGNNFQRGHGELPLYLPGNGSLLFALAMMLSGFGDTRESAGFPKDDLWDGIVAEGILPLPY
ncbi:MAG: glycoside hydrolase family 65 [Oscillospiraceae bacterium]|nr:glycoside hydrolase family 65 [Oscillospiraceae bacterium]